GPFDEEIIWLLTMLNLIEDGLSENHIQFVKNNDCGIIFDLKYRYYIPTVRKIPSVHEISSSYKKFSILIFFLITTALFAVYQLFNSGNADAVLPSVAGGKQIFWLAGGFMSFFGKNVNQESLVVKFLGIKKAVSYFSSVWKEFKNKVSYVLSILCVGLAVSFISILFVYRDVMAKRISLWALVKNIDFSVFSEGNHILLQMFDRLDINTEIAIALGVVAVGYLLYKILSKNHFKAIIVAVVMMALTTSTFWNVLSLSQNAINAKVKELAFYESKGDVFRKKLDFERQKQEVLKYAHQWDYGKGDPSLKRLKIELKNIRRDYKKGKISQEELLRGERFIVMNLAADVSSHFPYKKSNFSLVDIMKDKKANCVGYVQLYSILGENIGFDVIGVDILEDNNAKVFTMNERHVICLFSLSCDHKMIVDGNMISFPFILDNNYKKLGDYWEEIKENKASSYRRFRLLENGIVPLVYRCLAVEYSQKNQLVEAIALFYKTLELDPKDARSYEGLGYVYIKQEKYDEAIYCFEKSLILDNKDIMAWHCLAGLYDKKKDYANALYAYEQFLRFSSNATSKVKIYRYWTSKFIIPRLEILTSTIKRKDVFISEQNDLKNTFHSFMCLPLVFISIFSMNILPLIVVGLSVVCLLFIKRMRKYYFIQDQAYSKIEDTLTLEDIFEDIEWAEKEGEIRFISQYEYNTLIFSSDLAANLLLALGLKDNIETLNDLITNPSRILVGNFELFYATVQNGCLYLDGSILLDPAHCAIALIHEVGAQCLRSHEENKKISNDFLQIIYDSKEGLLDLEGKTVLGYNILNPNISEEKKMRFAYLKRCLLDEKKLEVDIDLLQKAIEDSNGYFIKTYCSLQSEIFKNFEAFRLSHILEKMSQCVMKTNSCLWSHSPVLKTLLYQFVFEAYRLKTEVIDAVNELEYQENRLKMKQESLFLNNYPLAVPRSVQRDISDRFGLKDLMKVTDQIKEEIALDQPRVSSFWQIFLKEKFISTIDTLRRELARDVLDVIFVITADPKKLQTDDFGFCYVSSCNISERTVYLHPYFFMLDATKRLEILFHEIQAHIFLGIRDEEEAMLSTVEFSNRKLNKILEEYQAQGLQNILFVFDISETIIGLDFEEIILLGDYEKVNRDLNILLKCGYYLGASDFMSCFKLLTQYGHRVAFLSQASLEEILALMFIKMGIKDLSAVSFIVAGNSKEEYLNVLQDHGVYGIKANHLESMTSSDVIDFLQKSYPQLEIFLDHRLKSEIVQSEPIKAILEHSPFIAIGDQREDSVWAKDFSGVGIQVPTMQEIFFYTLGEFIASGVKELLFSKKKQNYLEESSSQINPPQTFEGIALKHLEQEIKYIFPTIDGTTISNT
ncbi:MAG TPA: tetratricopeptide repeat protein, partial [Candidatus Omnitrophota bacterium]|nr:tetratricopeptide repeat protein [Candidatus Omnitrophota bacterium]